MGVEPVRSLDDLVKLGKHVKERGFKALKTNIFRFDLDPPNMIRSIVHSRSSSLRAASCKSSSSFSSPDVSVAAVFHLVM